MLQSSSQQIFIYGQPDIASDFWKNLTETHQVQTFQTDNIYQLQQYTKEISPEILIFNVNDATSLVDFKHAVARLEYSPLVILISPRTEISNIPHVAHHLQYPICCSELKEIIESYSIGHKRHDVLLIDRSVGHFNPLKQQLLEAQYRIFEVHTIDAAKLYLDRNVTKTVLIEYMPQFIAGRHYLQHSRIFYVDRQQDITEISKFLH